MRGSANRPVDGNRQRCVVCGHPRKEHRGSACSVPKCACADYTQRLLRGQTADAG